MRNAYKIFVRKSERKRLCGRHRHRWECDIRMVLRGIGWEDVVWIHLALDMNWWKASVIMVMKLQAL
jgi:hypothetical protein